MNLQRKAMGEYQTNCYIVTLEGKDFIIDPGVGATSWVLQNVTNPVAILNTHGHFDHVWSNAELQKELNIPLYTPKDDLGFLSDSSWRPDLPASKPDVLVEPNQTLTIDEVEVTFHHYAGHTPGCSMIEINNTLFSGDFLFLHSIGRSDFPYSSQDDMRKSLERFKKFERNLPIFPGHGESTSVVEEQKYSDYWIANL